MLYRKVHPDLFTAYPAEKVRWFHAVIYLSLTTMITQAGHLCPCTAMHDSAAAYTSPLASSVLIVLLQLENERSFKLLQVSGTCACDGHDACDGHQERNLLL
jgi:hypothetical protein